MSGEKGKKAEERGRAAQRGREKGSRKQEKVATAPVSRAPTTTCPHWAECRAYCMNCCYIFPGGENYYLHVANKETESNRT